MIKNVSNTYKSNCKKDSVKYREYIVIDNKELLETFTKNLAIEQKEQEEAEANKCSKDCNVVCSECEDC